MRKLQVIKVLSLKHNEEGLAFGDLVRNQNCLEKLFINIANGEGLKGLTKIQLDAEITFSFQQVLYFYSTFKVNRHTENLTISKQLKHFTIRDTSLSISNMTSIIKGADENLHELYASNWQSATSQIIECISQHYQNLVLL
ncbi:13282_t:CDS:2, partial [Ambispora gerdemannii]